MNVDSTIKYQFLLRLNDIRMQGIGGAAMNVLSYPMSTCDLFIEKVMNRDVHDHSDFLKVIYSYCKPDYFLFHIGGRSEVFANVLRDSFEGILIHIHFTFL